MATDDKRNRSLEQWNRDETRRCIERTAQSLRRLADEVDRIGSGMDDIGKRTNPTYSAFASDVLHAFAMWHMNAHLEQITQTAAEADIARAKGE